MTILKKLERQLLKDPQGHDNRILKGFVRSLCRGEGFKITELYELSYDNFDLSLKVLKTWRICRYTETCEQIRKMVAETSPVGA